MGRLYIPPPRRAPRLRLTAFDLVEIACLALFVGNLLVWASLFTGRF